MTAAPTDLHRRGRASDQPILVLEGGFCRGRSVDAEGRTFKGVLVTGMTGYQETEPSCHRQVVSTASHLGEDESGRIWVAGYVVRDPATASSWESGHGLADERPQPAAAGISCVTPGRGLGEVPRTEPAQTGGHRSLPSREAVIWSGGLS